jgi:cytochrome c oxidase subunit 3
MKIDHQKAEYASTPLNTKKILLWLAMVSMIMLFAGLTSAYMVRQAEGNWLNFQLPGLFTASTIVLALSSITMQLGVRAAKKGKIDLLRNLLMVTLTLGILFVALQFQGWKALVHDNVFFGGTKSNPSGSFLYVLTGLHLAHLAGGILYLLYVLFVTIKNSQIFGPKNVLSVELCATFWHFLDGLWIYLFLFLLFVK